MTEKEFFVKVHEKAQEIKELYEQVEKLEDGNHISLEVWGDNFIDVSINKSQCLGLHSISNTTFFENGHVSHKTMFYGSSEIEDSETEYFKSVEEYMESEGK